MSVKNAMLYLPDCIDSILKQTFQDWQLIAVNDGSEDDSMEILEHYAKDARISFYNNPGTGIIDALAFAYSKSRGVYITRMDADDLMTPDKLRLMSDLLDRKGKGFLAVGLVKYFSESKLGAGYKSYAQWLNHLTIHKRNFEDIYKECSIPSPAWMIHREDLDLCNGFQKQRYPEDYDLAFRFKRASLFIACVPSVIHLWRDHPARASRTDKHYTDNRFIEIKTHYFLDQDFQSNLPLIIWGSGKKGKVIAQNLQKENVEFDWVCNNPKKIGQEIYGVKLSGLTELSGASTSQVIVSISSEHDSKSINEFIKKNGQHKYFRFS